MHLSLIYRMFMPVFTECMQLLIEIEEHLESAGGIYSNEKPSDSTDSDQDIAIVDHDDECDPGSNANDTATDSDRDHECDPGSNANDIATDSDHDHDHDHECDPDIDMIDPNSVSVHI